MDKKVLIPLAQGFEMLEALAVVDVFRRGGVHVDTVALDDNLQVVSSHNVTVTADKPIAECMDEDYDLIVLPGGIPGAENLQNSALLTELLKKQSKEEKLYGAICASPALVLEHHGLLQGRKAACHPLFDNQIPGEQLSMDNVVIDGNCVTSRGAGTAIEFGLELLQVLMGKEKRDEVAKGMAIA